ncbi:uncharacterized protein LOC108738084 [Agrilus planipennis]|uniref:Uncharacterized protein LOC108738084 n=1 Tax=Agrilus planipennis TaxID=224129 RepID=A0A1W4WSF5_AGRPL|nr:uncharacterized protein LOC108738084 [Agrilus planipennis]
MNSFTVCFFVLLTTHGVLMDSSDSSESAVESFKTEFWENAQQLEKQVDDMVEGICKTKTGGKAAFKKFVQTREELSTCLQNVAAEKFELPSQVCRQKRPHIRSCLNAAVPGLIKCFDDDTKWFIRDFAIGSINSVFDFMCEDIFVSLQELMNLDGFDCMANMIKNEVAFDNSTDRCLLNLLSPENEYLNNPSKPLFCDGLRTVKSCFGKAIQEQCPTNNGILHINQGFMDALLKFCV